MYFLKALFVGFSLLVASIGYAQNSEPSPPRYLLGINELASQRFTEVWVKSDIDFKHYKRQEQFPVNQLPAYLKPKANTVSLLMAKPDSSILYKAAFLINATNDTVHIDRADATIAHIRTEVYTKGQWLTLQKDRGACCGNSYRTMSLAPKHYVLLQIDQLSGPMKVPYRIVVQVNGKDVLSEPTTVHLFPALLNLAGTEFTDP
ncbi:hypothetical protein [Spirosoma foliorum]|uniref:Uncharacterized protein n=1 Tax=Spirosoma foliorum TaxID=2710596 RepID=A0A7G5GZI5_9BACT|nr:hypothetical protein [Spirosoma foliorum]QMW04277.1 hypothetical protein H3H32_04815 [Spirosoma foliorum]